MSNVTLGLNNDLPREIGPGQYVMLVDHIGPALKVCRRVRGMTQNALGGLLAEVLNTEPIDQAYLSRVEGATVGISLDRFLAWCEVLRIDPRKVLDYAVFFAINDARPEEELLDEAIILLKAEILSREEGTCLVTH